MSIGRKFSRVRPTEDQIANLVTAVRQLPEDTVLRKALVTTMLESLGTKQICEFDREERAADGAREIAYATANNI